ncbi:hypothetical protein [Flavobacterium sp. 3HN19-14]|uniref:hypothetical protein n=1 Tax=Flavobacterium sp. 3HN19-14 TaxID=3448133 RepID=UPI003EDEA766
MATHLEGSISAYGIVQKLVDQVDLQKGYGYLYTDNAEENALLDFNREKEQPVISKNTLALPVTNYTYDIYSIDGQGIGGTFRPYRGQISEVSDAKVVDQSASNSLGGELELGAGAHVGLNFRTTNSTSYTGKWETTVTPYLKEKTTGNAFDYEKVYFKNNSETTFDNEFVGFSASMGGSKPITLKLDETKSAVNVYRAKQITGIESNLTAGTPFNILQRTHREKRNQVVQKITKAEAKRFGLFPFININGQATFTAPNTVTPIAPGHHTAAFIVTDENGSRHIYGETVYNKTKKEVTFAVGSNAGLSAQKELVTYSEGDNTVKNGKGRTIITMALQHRLMHTLIF